uniref:Uncharacterized protein n=1 Tax=Panagrolaimus sp. ES5 TaxID=591445 RepID=A0AC34G6Z4_9BILA
MSYNNGYSKKQRQQLQQQQSNYEPPNYQVPPQNISAPRYRPRKEKFYQSAPYQYEPRSRYPYAQPRPQYYQQQHTVAPPPPTYVFPPPPQQQEPENSNDVAEAPPVDIQAIEKVSF